MKKYFCKVVLILPLLMLSDLAIATTSMSVSQEVMFDGFKGAQFSYFVNQDQIGCGDDNVKSYSYAFPKALPSQKQDIDANNNKFSIHFDYDVPWGADAQCSIPMMTVITWQSESGAHSCAFATILAGNAMNFGVETKNTHVHMCQIGDGTGKGMDCHVEGCEPMKNKDDHDDFGGHLWTVSPNE